MTPALSNVAISASTFTAEISNGSAATAPDPSPSRISNSSSGFRFRCPSAIAWAGSADWCPATHHSRAPGASSSATTAAAPTTTPSSTTGVRRTAACAKNPAIAARSAPPPVASNAIGSLITRRARRSASRIAAVLRIHAWSSIPVPRPTTATGSDPVSDAISTAAGVVLPMPMSPATSTSAPASTSSSAMARPATIASSHCSRVSASSRSIDPEDRRTLCWLTAAGVSASTAMSTTRTVAPATCASTFTAAPPVRKLATICPVTSLGYADTP